MNELKITSISLLPMNRASLLIAFRCIAGLLQIFYQYVSKTLVFCQYEFQEGLPHYLH